MKCTIIGGALVAMAAGLPGMAWGAGSVDAGRSYFQPGVAPGFGLCVSCHVDPPGARRFVPARFSPSFLTSAFQRVPRMNGNLDLLGPEGINDVATYLGLVGLGKSNATDADRLFDWGEDTFPQLLSPARQVTGELLGYTYRFYPATGVYVGIKDGGVFFFDSRTPGAAIEPLGSVRSFLAQLPDGR